MKTNWGVQICIFKVGMLIWPLKPSLCVFVYVICLVLIMTWLCQLSYSKNDMDPSCTIMVTMKSRFRKKPVKMISRLSQILSFLLLHFLNKPNFPKFFTCANSWTQVFMWHTSVNMTIFTLYIYLILRIIRKKSNKTLLLLLFS